MESGTSLSTVGFIKSKKSVVVSKGLFDLIASVKKKMQLVTNLDEVLDGLKCYIAKKQLFDPSEPMKICCNDELAGIFGVKQFEICELKDYLKKLVFPVSDSYNDFPLPNVSSKGCKRKLAEDSDDSFGGVTKKISPPMILYIPDSPNRSYDGIETDASMQGYETALARDTSDDGDDEFFSPGDLLAVEETFDVEYEIESSCSETNDSSDDSSSEDALDSTIIFVCKKTDSDQECWADDSSDDDISDAEITDSDKWKCKQCSSLNNPKMRCCVRCWQTRSNWLAGGTSDRMDRRTSPKRFKPPRKRNRALRNDKTTPLAQKEPPILACTSQENQNCNEDKSQSIENSDTNALKMCLLCCSKPVNSAIVHGKFAHCICCYTCARFLKKRKQSCPICRRTIDRVVYQIS